VLIATDRLIQPQARLKARKPKRSAPAPGAEIIAIRHVIPDSPWVHSQPRLHPYRETVESISTSTSGCAGRSGSDALVYQISGVSPMNTKNARLLISIAPLSAMMLLAGTTMGQQADPRDRDRPVQGSQQANENRQTVMFTLTSKIRGKDIYNRQDEEIGTISDLVVDVQRGKAIYAVVSFGGWLGIDSESVAVPLSALSWDAANDRFTLPVTKDRLEGAPKFDSEDWDQFRDKNWRERTRSAFGELPELDQPNAEQPQRPGDSRANRSPYDRYMLSTKLDDAMILGQDGEEFGAIEDLILDHRSGDIGFVTLETGGVLGIGAETRIVPWEALTRRENTRFSVAMNASQVETAPKVRTDKVAELRNERMNKDIYAFYSVEARRDWAGGNDIGQTMFASASSIADSEIVNRQGETLGEIDDLVIGLDRGNAPYAVVSYGGVVGIGDETVAIPLRALSWDRSEDRFELPLTRDRLENAPEFDSKNLNGIDDENWRNETRRVFGEVPNLDRANDRRNNPGNDARDRSNRNLDAYLLASKVRGMNIVGSGDEQLGSVKDVILDRTTGHVGFVTMEVDGTMDIDAEIIAVPWEALTRADNNRFRIQSTRASLQKAPRIEAERIADLNDRQFTQRIYSFFEVERRPMLIRDRRNDQQRDRDRREPNPGSQR
jgi:sporulation protein YlmC with PRC-barrel domain